MLPIIKYSVTWWSTLHQPSTGFGSTVDPALRWPLLIMAAASTILFLSMHLKAMRNEVLRRRAKSLMLAEVERSRLRAKPLPAE
jgi:heme exporter protein C